MLIVLLIYFALLALSVFNTIVLLWLGATVLLAAERRGWGAWLAGCGLLAGGAVFISHSAVLMRSASVISAELNAWWPLGWAALVFAPFAWYVAMLWHTGYWDDRDSALHRRHRPLLGATTMLALALLVVARPLPFALKASGLDLSTTPAVLGMPLVVLLYPLFIASCITFSLAAVLRPAPATRAMGGLARRRARPWLIAAAGMLLVVSLLVVGVMVWLLRRGAHALDQPLDWLAMDLGWFDLVVTSLISAAVVLIGQAVISYEIFTGRTLPRRGLRRQWHGALLLAAGYGMAIAACFALLVPTAYIVLLATVVIGLTYAVFSWRSHLERDGYIAHLRPFVASERVYDALLTSSPTAAPDIGASAPFVALCRDVLGAQSACLVATGGIAPLVGPALVYPEGGPLPADVHRIIARCVSPEVTILGLDPLAGGVMWAVPLWSPRGLIGVLLLGAKRDGGLYSEEEIEIARASGQRLLDTVASASLAQRLMALQRQRFTDSQVLDRQSRRALHDEILPGLHAAMLALRSQSARGQNRDEALAQLAQVHQRISALLREMPAGGASQVAQIGLLAALRRMVEAEFPRDFEAVSWQVDAPAEENARALSPLTADVLFYAAKEVIRNAARHGRGGNPARSLRLRIDAAWRQGLEIRITDDGVGLPTMLRPAPADGQGLALHGTMLAIIGGSLVTEGKSGAGATAALFLPEERCREV